MKKSVLSIISIGILTMILTGCGKTSTSPINVVSDLNKLMNECVSQNDIANCKRNDKFQAYLDTYSNYKLLNASDNEFTTRPQEANSLFSYGASTGGMCGYCNAFIYCEDGDTYYSVSMSCEKVDSVPNFEEATELK